MNAIMKSQTSLSFLLLLLPLIANCMAVELMLNANTSQPQTPLFAFVKKDMRYLMGFFLSLFYTIFILIREMAHFVTKALDLETILPMIHSHPQWPLPLCPGWGHWSLHPPWQQMASTSAGERVTVMRMPAVSMTSHPENTSASAKSGMREMGGPLVSQVDSNELQIHWANFVQWYFSLKCWM